MKKGKSGQQSILTAIVTTLLVIFILGTIIVIFSSGQGLGGVGNAVSSVADAFMSVLKPLFNFLLGAASAGTDSYLMVLIFIMISIILIGTLDTVNLFGEDDKGKLINFFVGLIVAIIGVRTMPPDLWGSLTAGTNAFVITIFIGLPILALTVLTMKMRHTVLIKLFWIFFIVFDVYLMMRLPPNTGAGWGVRGIYLVALILAGFMLFFDATIRRFYYKEMNKKEIEDTIGDIDAQARYDLRAKIANWEKIKADPNASAQEVGRAKERLAHYQKVYGDVSAI